MRKRLKPVFHRGSQKPELINVQNSQRFHFDDLISLIVIEYESAMVYAELQKNICKERQNSVC